jgi:hypothetical protein
MPGLVSWRSLRPRSLRSFFCFESCFREGGLTGARAKSSQARALEGAVDMQGTLQETEPAPVSPAWGSGGAPPVGGEGGEAPRLSWAQSASLEQSALLL